MKIDLKIAAGLCIVLLLGAAGLFGTEYLLSSGDGSSEDGGDQRFATRIGVTSPEMRVIENDVSAIGSLRPLRSVEIVPYVSGRVAEVAVSSGADVDEGDLIVQLDDSGPRADLAEAEATLSEARQEFRRIEELAGRDTVSEARLEEARAVLRRSEAAVSAAQASIADHRITAPFAGTLGLIDVEPGAFLDMSRVVTTLSDISSVELAADLSERYFGDVQQGQRISVSVPAYPDRTFEGEVVVRAPQIDPASRNFTFRARIDNPDRLLVGGMFADARLVLGSYEGLAVADDAIISEGLTTYVFTVADGVAQRTELETGTSLGALTEVRSGLEAEDRVVVAGWDRLSDGAPVEIAEDVAREGLQ